ncbi:DNA internalization-related competence protein ComEC/Rec2 [Salinimonas sp. HHU 13199]|uniref:DNA internalization-related competence protein ComEC/Rec2 n=1 Tax=Salinimonas profundi TaxID=2729140 RepID=A0ABR8LI10_9ALTE|nr:DNA internalization-related competence protein ComEC/Rec2 [Salinimonas profundi]MBD3584606.1 DNA internalization-related competence protein ComEC/Rec2 [Salinimonas profundi]
MQKKITLTLSGFSVACLSATVWPVLPHPLLLTVMLIAACLFHLGAGLRRHLSFVPRLARNSLPGLRTYSARSFIVGFIAGCVWMASLGYWYLCWQLPEQNNPQISVFRFKVTESRREEDDVCRLQGVPLTNRIVDNILQPNFLLYWRLAGESCPSAGQILEITARLKKPAGLLNPGAPDRAKWLLSEKIVRTGNVKELKSTLTPEASHLHDRMVGLLNTLDMPNEKWSQSLLVGNRNLMTPADWALLASSGTAHLFSISGMHLGLVALWAAVVSRILLPLLHLSPVAPAQWNLRRGVAIVNFFACMMYTALADWQLPVVRALLLIGVFLWQQCMSRHVSAHQKIWLMIFLCCLLFPFSLFSGGFYLSIVAVIFIWFLTWRYNPSLLTFYDKVRWAVKLQILLSITLSPLTLMWFGEQSVLAPLINVIAIPVVTLLLPVGLTGLLLINVLPDLSILLLYTFDTGVGHLMALIKTLTKDIPLLTLSLSTSSLLCIMLGVVIAFVPSFKGKWYLTGVLFFPALTDRLAFDASQWYLHVFDAGQGTALLVSRGNDGVLIDTGAAYAGNSVIKSQVAPALTRLGITQIHHVFISHHDNDHAGGLPFLPDIKQIVKPASIITPVDKCQNGFSQAFAGLTITSVWPEQGTNVKGNNYSCVLVVSDGEYTVLAPGDIERWAEYELLYKRRLPDADIVIAPHHGSRTSSGNLLIKATSPRWVIYTQGRDNRWGFPALSVTQRYQRLNARQMKTSESGYMRFRMLPDNVAVHVHSRSTSRRWYHRQ